MATLLNHALWTRLILLEVKDTLTDSPHLFTPFQPQPVHTFSAPTCLHLSAPISTTHSKVILSTRQLTFECYSFHLGWCNWNRCQSFQLQRLLYLVCSSKHWILWSVQEEREGNLCTCTLYLQKHMSTKTYNKEVQFCLDMSTKRKYILAANGSYMHSVMLQKLPR